MAPRARALRRAAGQLLERALGPIGGPLDQDPLLGSRGSHLFGGLRRGGPRNVVVSVGSTVLVFAVLGYIVVISPGWPDLQLAFFDPE